MFQTLQISTEGSIGRLQLDRPEKLNPLSTEALIEIAEAARWFDQQPEIKVVIVGGAGRAFSAGADLSTFSGPNGPGALSTREAAECGRTMADALENMKALSLARIQGWCVGGGLVLAHDLVDEGEHHRKHRIARHVLRAQRGGRSGGDRAEVRRR